MEQVGNPSVPWPDPDHVLRTLGFRPGMTVLEFCCNDGFFTVPLARAVAGNLFVFDVDIEALDRTRAAFTRAGNSARGWIWDDPENLAKVLPEPVDAVFMADVLHAVSDKQDLVKAISPTLKPNGRLAVVGRNSSLGGLARAQHASPEDIHATIGPVGFGLGEVLDLSPHHYGAVFNKIDQ